MITDLREWKDCEVGLVRTNVSGSRYSLLADIDIVEADCLMRCRFDEPADDIDVLAVGRKVSILSIQHNTGRYLRATGSIKSIDAASNTITISQLDTLCFDKQIKNNISSFKAVNLLTARISEAV